MKVLQLVSGTGVNGAVRHCYDLTLQLAQRGCRVVLAHKPGAWIATNDFPPEVELLETSLRRKPAELRRMAGELRRRRVDVIHSHLSSAHFFGVLLARFFDFRCVATSHMPRFQPHWWWNDRVIAPCAANAKFQRRINRVPSRRTDVIHCFIDPKRLKPQRCPESVRRELNIPAGSFVMTVAGDVSRRKAQHVLLRSLPDLIRSNVRPHLVLAGRIMPDYRPFLEREIDRLSVRAHVTLAGLRQDVPDLLGASDCCCLSSRREMTPISLLEAMSMGLPAVATDVGGVSECVRDGVDGFVVKPNRPGLFSERLLALAGNFELRRRMGQNAQRWMEEEFHPDVCVPRIVDSYRKACGRSEPGQVMPGVASIAHAG